MDQPPSPSSPRPALRFPLDAQGPPAVVPTSDRVQPNLYDIGEFLAGGLNLTPEAARDLVCRERERTRSMERDQEDCTIVEYDDLADLMDMAERLLDMWEGDDHRLVNTDGTVVIEHSLRCRAQGTMATCWAHTAAVVALVALPGGRLDGPIQLVPRDELKHLARVLDDERIAARDLANMFGPVDEQRQEASKYGVQTPLKFSSCPCGRLTIGEANTSGTVRAFCSCTQPGGQR